MKKTILALAAISAAAAVTAFAAPENAPKSAAEAPEPAKAAQTTLAGKFESLYDYDVADDHVNFYLFKLAGLGGGVHRGFMHATSQYPNERRLVSEWPHLPDRGWDAGEHLVTAACMVGNEIWAYVCESWVSGMSYKPCGLYKINMETGLEESTPLYSEYQENAENYNQHISELSYDPSTGYLYGLRNKAGGWLGLELELERDVVRLDVEKPNLGWETVGSIDHSFTMAADEGYIYFVQGNFKKTVDDEGNTVNDLESCSLYKINSDDYAGFSQSDLELVGKINSGFLKINYLQTMEFDHSDHTLWWHGAKYDSTGTPFMTRLDTKTADTDDPLVTTEGPVSLVGLCIPYEYVDKAAPHYVRNLSVVTGAEGAAEATFSWTNPTLNSNRTALDALASVKVYRDGQLYKTLTDVKPGEAYTWKDQGQTSGLHSYKFVAANSHGDGLSRQKNIFVGHDVPKAPADLKVVTNGTKATISWTAPVTGVNNGWIDKTTLKYDVKRLPDNKTVATGISETSCTDESTKYMGYSYVVTPSTADGKGESATSDMAPFGPAVEVPYLNELRSANDANMLTIIDANKDGNKFEFDITPAEQGVTALWIGSSGGQADDYVILPELNFQEGKQYKMYVTFAVSNYSNKKEKFELRQGTSNTAEAQTNLLDTWIVNTKFGEYEMEKVIVPDPSKGNYLSIRLASDADQGWVVIRSIDVREYSDKDASLVDFDGPQTAYTLGKNTYEVTVCNEGKSAMRGAKAQLLSYPQLEVLAEAEVPATKAGDTSVAKVEWQPSKTGSMNVTARVVLDGDTYEADNETARYLPVEVKYGYPSDWKRVLTQDNIGFSPFYTMMGWTQLETIYTAEEVGLENVTITGISYEYEPSDAYENALTAIPVEIYLATTDRSTLSRWDNTLNGYYGDMLPENIYTKCFEGEVNMAGRQAKNVASMMFNTTFFYDGKSNLAVRNLNTNESATKTNNYWAIKFEEYSKELQDWRSARYNPSQAVPCKLNSQVPVIKLAYRNGDDSGVNGTPDGFITLGAGAYVVGDCICFNKVQDRIDIFTLAGAKVASAANTDKVAGLAPGVYVATGHLGADVASCKLVVR